jgi:hypothetical protein
LAACQLSASEPTDKQNVVCANVQASVTQGTVPFVLSNDRISRNQSDGLAKEFDIALQGLDATSILLKNASRTGNL